MRARLNSLMLIKKNLDELFGGIADKFTVGKIITGKVVTADGDGVLIDIEYKSKRPYS